MHSNVLRKCKYCGIEAITESELDLFVTAKDCNYGRKPLCKSCRQDKRTDKQSKEYAKKYYQENKEKLSEQKKVYWDSNKEYFALKAKKLYELKKEERLAKVKEYRAANKGKANAWTRKYKADKLQRTPKWLTEDDYWLIEQAYITAQERTDRYGIKFHVDHIIPLRGKTVSGLHVPSNLQVIPWYENLEKSNKLVA